MIYVTSAPPGPCKYVILIAHSLCSYRDASVEVIEVMSRFAVIERASIDEAYMDLTAAVQQRLKDMARQTHRASPAEGHLHPGVPTKLT